MRRVVTSYTLHRSASGRLTSGVDSSEPDKLRGRVTQLQNTPKGVRDIVVAEPGHVLVAADWAGIEWAIAMWMVGKVYNDGYHTDMLDRFYHGEFDPHNFLAEVAGCERQVAKVYSHGYNYDGSPRTLARNAGHTDAIGIQVCAAHDKAFRTRPWKEAVVAKAKKQRYIQTPLGWRRYFWGWQPKPAEALGTLVQATAADLCKVVLGSIFKELPKGWEILTSTHDSVMLMVPQICNTAPEYEASWWLKEQMQQPIPWLDGRSWRCDVKVGRTWKDVS